MTYLEMTGFDLLRPAATVAAVSLEPVDNLAPMLRDLVARVGAAHDWASLRYSAQQWQQAMAQPGLRHWMVVIDGAAVGVVGLQAHPDDEVEITKFGLVPEALGHGCGGTTLTEAIRLAWAAGAPAAPPVRRVWLHTSSRDHPHAIGNYQRRGFLPFRLEDRQRARRAAERVLDVQTPRCSADLGA